MTTRLGIIGGGQLALYLCQAAQALGAEVAVIAEPGDAPALKLADKAHSAELDNLAAIDKFLADADVVTFDKEAIPDETLLHLIAAEEQGRTLVRPGADILLLLKDKALQKNWLVQHNLPTLPYVVLSGDSESLSSLQDKLGAGLVQKVRCGGYDGRGVQILKPTQTSQKLWDVPSLVEPFLPECREISVIAARSQTGEIEIYPPVSMEFDPQLNSVETVTMPASIDAQKTREAQDLGRRALEALGGVGLFAIEMFITREGELLVNEISPRVHNSGHVTLDACNVSQFEQHVRAVMGMPLAPVKLDSPAAMINILYTDDFRAICPSNPVAQTLPDLGTTVYWYGKTTGQMGRKMGHINSVGADVGEALELAQRALLKLRSKGKAA